MNPVLVRRPTALQMWCPGCDGLHVVQVKGEDGTVPLGPVWDWDGSMEQPTIAPSILVKGSLVCHSFVKAGKWHFLGDCTHKMKNLVVDMVPVPDWLTEEGKRRNG